MTRLMIIHFKGEEEVKWDAQVTGLDSSMMVVSLIKRSGYRRRNELQ